MRAGILAGKILSAFLLLFLALLFVAVSTGYAVTNQPPVTSLTGPASAMTGETFVLTAGASDADGNVVRMWVTDSIGCTSSLGAVDVFNASASYQFNASCSANGTKEFRLYATDNNRAVASTTYTVSIYQSANNPPAVIVKGPPVNPKTGENFTVAVTATDSDGRVVVFTATTMTTGCALIQSIASGLNKSVAVLFDTYSCSSAGGKTFSYTVVDAKGASATASASVTVDANNAPKIIVFPVIPKKIKPNQSVSFYWAATDADNDNLSWSATWGDNTGFAGICPASTKNWQLNASHNWTNTGVYVVTAAVSDCKDGSDQQQTSVTVSEEPINNPPVVTVKVPENATTGATFSLTGIAVDQDGVVAEMKWTVPADCVLISQDTVGINRSVAESTALYSCLLAGTKAFSVTATDNSGGSASRTANVVVYTNTTGTVAITVNGTKIIVISPNGGEQWTKGITQNIRWSAPASVASVGIDAVTSDVCTTLVCPPVRRYTIAAQTPNDGQFEWTISLGAGSYKIGIYDSADYSKIDYSDNAFTIFSVAVATNSSINISGSPTAGSVPLNVTFTTVVRNINTPIQWDFGDYTGAAEPCIVQFGGTTCTNIVPNRTVSISHVYQRDGTYQAFAQSSSNGIVTMSNTVTITVGQTSSAAAPVTAPSPAAKTTMRSGTQPSAANFTICQNASWTATSGEGWVNYTCSAECGEDWTRCIYTSNVTDAKGRPLYMLAFAVDGAGGEFRWNLPYENEYKAALLTHSGGGGTAFVGDQQEPARNMLDELEKAGLLAAGIKWQSGAVVSNAPTGWYSLSQANEKSTYYEKTKRAAAAIRWVHDSLIPASLRFGTMSCSGGSVATYSSVYWHGLDDQLDYQLVGGGPPAAWDGNAVCTGQAGTGEPVGICERNPEKACTSDAECGSSSKCAFPRQGRNIVASVMVSGVKNQIDYVHGLTNTCVAGKADPAFDASSYRTTAGDAAFDHPVDFVVDIGGGPYDTAFATDTELTVTYTAGRTYSSIATTDPQGKKWLIHTGDHCSWLGDGSFLNNTILPTILAGLKLAVPASVTVLEPNGDEYWEAGKTYTVSWTSANAPNGSWVGRIALYQGASFLVDVVPFLSPLLANGSVQWTVPNNSVLGNDFKVQVILYNGPVGNESELAQDFSDAAFSIVAPLAVQQYPLKLTKGWNLFSSPVFEYTPTPFMNFTNNCTYQSALLRYSNENHRFEKADYVTTSREGYWIKVANNCTAALTGQMRTLEEFFTDMNLSKGWNIIGGVPEATSFTNITGCEVRRGYYWYDPAARRWEKATTMEPGKGYLVNVKESCQLQSGAAQIPGKPNIVVIMSDDQDAASIWVMSKVNSYLAQKGTTFPNNFVSYSLCCPSRATFLTGQYAHNNKVFGNIPPEGGYYALDHNNTLPVWLQKAGYRTAHIGKYLNGYGQPSASELAKKDEYVPENYETLAKSMTSPALEIPPGYTEWYGLVDPSTYAYYYYTINENGKLKKYGNQPRDYQTDVLTAKAVSFIERTAGNNQPFFLVVAYVAPHAGIPPPVTEPEPAPRHKNALENCTLPRPPPFNEEDVSDKAAVNQLKSMMPAEIKLVESSYCNRLRSLLAVDDGVEKIVKALEKSGKLQNTYVFYTSDNGFMQGEHRIPQGKGYPYEESARTPLIILGPSVPAGQTITQLVGNIDLAPTFAELAQASANRVMDGLSLMPLVRNTAASWRKDYLLEGLQIYLYSAVRNDKYTYAEFLAANKPSGQNTEAELYNFVDDACHKADPYQLESQAQNACYTSTIEELKERLNTLKTCSGESCW